MLGQDNNILGVLNNYNQTTIQKSLTYTLANVRMLIFLYLQWYWPWKQTNKQNKQEKPFPLASENSTSPLQLSWFASDGGYHIILIIFSHWDSLTHNPAAKL